MQLTPTAKTSFAILLLGISICAASAYAKTPPAIKASDGSNIVTIDSTGNAVFSGTCTNTTCATKSASGSAAGVAWSGNIGNFTFGLTGSYTLIGGLAPYLDINVTSLVTSNDGGGTLTIEFTNTGISGGPTYLLNSTSTWTPLGTDSVVYNAYADPGNLAFNISSGKAVLVGSLSGVTTKEYEAFTTGPSSSAMSMTPEVVLVIGGGESFSSDFYMQAGTYVSSTCANITATLNAPITPVTLTASGGVPPTGGTTPTYTFTATGLPAGLSISSDGIINGTPTVAGTYKYTVTIEDMWGDIGTLNCSVTVGSPGLTLTKTASPTKVAPFQEVTYTYTVTNTGGITLTNIVVVDDNGTPRDRSDDHTVGTIASLAPGASQTLTWTTYPTLSTVVVDNASGVIPGGTLAIQKLPNGYLKFFLNQSTSLNDNTYGTWASSDWGSNGHKAQDLYNTDHARFAFYDGKGNLDLEVDSDYSSSAGAPAGQCPNPNYSAYKSGYGTLGACGGDGQFVTPGSRSPYLVDFDSTLTENLNQSPEFYQYASNSPDPASPDYSKWNPVVGYTLTIDPKCFGSNGFGSVEVPVVHNSPSKNCTDQVCHTPASSVETNIATATASVSGSGDTLTAQAQASVTITSNIEPTKPQGGGGGNSCPAPSTSPLTVKFPSGGCDNDGKVGTSYHESFTASGGKSPYTFAITSGALPAGLYLNASTGAITGVPTTVIDAPLTVTVTDSSHPAVTASASGYINILAAGSTAPPGTKTARLKVTFPSANGTVGVLYSASFTATGGTSPYTFAITSGALPAGLTLNASTGAITGTPTAEIWWWSPGAQLTVTVTDSSSPALKATASGTIDIAPAPAKPPTPPPAKLTLTYPCGPATNGTVGKSYSVTPTVKGGVSPYTFSLTKGTLPAPLKLNASTGAITGTPAAAVSGYAAQVTVTVKDSTGATATGTITIDIVAASSTQSWRW